MAKKVVELNNKVSIIDYVAFVSAWFFVISVGISVRSEVAQADQLVNKPVVPALIISLLAIGFYYYKNRKWSVLTTISIVGLFVSCYIWYFGLIAKL